MPTHATVQGDQVLGVARTLSLPCKAHQRVCYQYPNVPRLVSRQLRARKMRNLYFEEAYAGEGHGPYKSQL